MPANQKLLSFGALPYSSPYYSIGIEDCINYYVEISPTQSSKVEHYYVSIPGLQMFSQPTGQNPCRGIYRTSDSRVFGVFGNNLVEILQNGQRLIKGTITTYSGPCQMVDNTHQLLLVDGAFGYILDLPSNSFSQIDPNSFPNGATHCDCIDTEFLANQPNSINYQWSNENDGINWDPLNFASKEGLPDNIVGLKNVSNQLWVFGSYSTEVHYDTGDILTQQWQRLEGAVIDVGCSAPYSVAKIEVNIFWLGADKSGNIAVWSNNGLQPVKISNRGIEQMINYYAGTDIPNAIGYTYAQAGHVFYVLTFPGGNVTFVYDATTNAWHRRSYLDSDGGVNKWRGLYSVYAWGLNLFGDTFWDNIYQANMNYYLNDDPDPSVNVNYIQRVKTTPVLQLNQKRVKHIYFQPVFEQGVGLNDNSQFGFGQLPQCLLYISNDSGQTFPTRRTGQLGAQGNYNYKTVFRMLGISTNRVYKIIITDPVPVILVGFVVDMEEGES